MCIFGMQSDSVEVWCDDIDELELSKSASKTKKPLPYINQLYLMFLFLWQSTFRLSDAGMSILFRFLSLFLGHLATALGIPSLKAFADSLPTSVANGRKALGTHTDAFEKYVCCPSCSALYSVKDCVEHLPNGDIISKTCPYVCFPRHPQKQHRKACGTLLLKTVRTSAGSTALYPRMLYCYKSFIESLQGMLLRPDFLNSCEKWRNRSIQEGCLEDVYDGRIWKEFMSYKGTPFLSVPYNFALSLNVDWFQPFKRTNYSVGALYIAIQNLPREERFLSENTILVGVIPGEPKLVINTLLEPLVDDLLKLWDGVIMKSVSQNSVLVRAALVCVTCDVPAARKVCGFVGHNALKACTKCLKDFPTDQFGDQPDYTGFDREHWPLRTNSAHRKNALEHRKCQTQSKKHQIEREHGCRYSVLLRLPYFDPVRMCVIDPMHNLLLGTARHMISVWKHLEIIKEKDFPGIQSKVNAFITPDDIGRIPSKIASSFSGFTAEQWRNWTLIFSLYALKEYLPYQHYQCWHLFVKSCHLLCRRSITVDNIESGDKFLLEFCSKFEQVYGGRHCNINLHLHTHLASCILDFGPVYAFWLFSFERMNGILGSFHTNCRDVSLQLMRKFMQMSEYGINNWPEEYRSVYVPLIINHRYCKGSLIPLSLESMLIKGACVPLPPIREHAFPSRIKSSLIMTLRALHYFTAECTIEVMSLYQKCKAVELGRFTLGSNGSRHNTASIVQVRTLQGSQLSLGEIQYYFKFHVKVSSTSGVDMKSFWFAAVLLFEPHNCKVWFGTPVQVWSRVTLPDHLFIPLSYIKSRTAYVSTPIDFGRVIGMDNVLVVVPLLNDMHSLS